MIARAYAVMPFVWSIGTIVGPAIGGTLAHPATVYPAMFSSSGIFATFPYLLPNLICALLLLASILAGYFFLAETHPNMQPWSSQADLDNSTATASLMATSGAIADSGVDLRAYSYGTFNQVDIQTEEKWIVNADGSSRPPSVSSQAREKVFTRPVVMLVMALGIFTYHSMTYDHLLPIFLEDDVLKGPSTSARGALNVPGGLGLTAQQVGVIMSFNGLIALCVQGIVFPLFAEWLGVWRVFILVTFLHPLAYFVVPYLAFLPRDLLYPGIYACLTLRNFLSILAYPVILILLKQASPESSVLGAINGLAASAGAACRTAAPPIAGLLYDLGGNLGFTGLAWWGSALVAILGAIQLFWVQREKHKIAIVRSVAPSLVPGETPMNHQDVVHITVREV